MTDDAQRQRRLIAVVMAVSVALALVLPARLSVAVVPPGQATHLFDVDASPTNSIVLNGITLTWREGDVGSAVNAPDATGTPDNQNPSSTTIQTTNRRTADVNNPLTNYIWAAVSFSQPIAVGDAFGVGDLDGSQANGNWEVGGVVAFNNGVQVNPSITTGNWLNSSARNVANSPPGFAITRMPVGAADGQHGEVAAGDARARMIADFGTQLVTDVVFIWAIGATAEVNGAQRGVLYDIGFENIPALAPLDPSIELVKSLAANADGDDSGTVSLGDLLTYELVLTNTGNTVLDPLTVTDSLPGMSPVSCPVVSLAPEGTTTCTATYVVAQPDVDAGEIENTATATGTPPAGDPVTSTSTVTTPVPQSPAIEIDKSPASGTGPFDPGDPIAYDVTITNTGNVTLTGVVYSDPTLGITDATCATGTLAPGASTTCSVTTVATQPQIDAGTLANTATTTGTPPTGPPVTDDDDALIVLQQTPAIQLIKTVELTGDADDSGTASAGDTLTYSFEISNTGDVTLDPVVLDDPVLGLTAITCGDGALAPGASTTCTETYVITDAHVATGSIDNTATATGGTASGLTVNSADSESVPTFPRPAPDISLTKLRTGGPEEWGAGDVLEYSLEVANTGNVTLTAVSVDDATTGPVSCPETTLEPDASMVCTAAYAVTQADVDAGSIVNTATVIGTPPAGPTVDDDATHTEDTDPAPAIDLVKQVDGDVLAGEVLSYTFVLTNTGSVTLTDVAVTDPLPGLSAVSCETTTLAPGGTVDCTATYPVTQADVDAGSIENAATATGTPPEGLDPPTSEDSAIVEAPPPSPTLRLDKSVELTDDADGDEAASAGDGLTYTFVLTNTGDVTLSDVSLDDVRLGISDLVCDGVATLAPAASTTCTAAYVVTAQDVVDGVITNTATATGTPPSGPPIEDEDSSTVLPPQQPGIGLTKSVSSQADTDDSGNASAGDRVSYQFLVENSGNVPLTAVTVDDPRVGPVSCPQPNLAVAASMTCTATYVLTQPDVDAGEILNLGTASGSPPGGLPPVEDTSTTTTPLLPEPGVSSRRATVPIRRHRGPVTSCRSSSSS